MTSAAPGAGPLLDGGARFDGRRGDREEVSVPGASVAASHAT